MRTLTNKIKSAILSLIAVLVTLEFPHSAMSVFVNGTAVRRNGAETGARPGGSIRRQTYNMNAHC